MSGDEGWRPEVNATDYFGNQKKKLGVADRRPLIRKASDLVGPGIDANAIRITNFNDLLATFDGYFACAAGATNAPTSTEAFSGFISSDSELGGVQLFFGLTTGIQYERMFTRSPLDPSAIFWGTWQTPSPTGAGDSGWVDLASYHAGWGAGTPKAQSRKIDNHVYLRGLAKRTAGTDTVIGTLVSDHVPPQTFSIYTRTTSASLPFAINVAGDLVISTLYATNDNVSLDNLDFLVD